MAYKSPVLSLKDLPDISMPDEIFRPYVPQALMAMDRRIARIEGRWFRLRRPKHEHRDCRGRFAKQMPTVDYRDFWSNQLYTALGIPHSVMLPKEPICPNTTQ